MAAEAEAVRAHAPASEDDAAELLRACAEAGDAVRIRGGGTKLGWGNPVAAGTVLDTRGLSAIVEHNPGDLTAVLQPGVPLAEAQAAFAAHGQRLALDPPLGEGETATVGGVVATADSGPLRHRYGGVRDLIIGIRVALPDGSVVKAGGKVIKNVAGYDLAKLSAGAFGTLGAIVEVAVRLHPVPARTASAAARTQDPLALARALARIAHSPLDADALDVAWREGHGGGLVRFGGATAVDQAGHATALLREEPGLDVRVLEDDEAAWAQQREKQRGGAVLKVAGEPARLPAVLRAADAAGAEVVGRAAAGLSWLRLPAADAARTAARVRGLRKALAPAACVLLDAPAEVRAALDPWGEEDEALLALSRRLKERFDPAGVCNPGLFVGGL